MIRLLFCVQVLVGIALFSSQVRDFTFPDGTTTPEILIFLLILFVWEDILRIKKRLKA